MARHACIALVALVMSCGRARGSESLSMTLHIENPEIMVGEGISGYVTIHNWGTTDFVFRNGFRPQLGDMGVTVAGPDGTMMVGKDPRINIFLAPSDARLIICAGASIRRPLYVLKMQGDFVFAAAGRYSVIAAVLLWREGNAEMLGLESGAVAITVRDAGPGLAEYTRALRLNLTLIDVEHGLGWGHLDTLLTADPQAVGSYGPALRRYLSTQYGSPFVRGYYGTWGGAKAHQSDAWWSNVIERGSFFSEPGSIMSEIWSALRSLHAKRTMGQQVPPSRTERDSGPVPDVLFL